VNGGREVLVDLVERLGRVLSQGGPLLFGGLVRVGKNVNRLLTRRLDLLVAADALCTLAEPRPVEADEGNGLELGRRQSEARAEARRFVVTENEVGRESVQAQAVRVLGERADLSGDDLVGGLGVELEGAGSSSRWSTRAFSMAMRTRSRMSTT
jgi:hypothetical protein